MPQRYEEHRDDREPQGAPGLERTETVEADFAYTDDAVYGPSTVIAALDQIEVLVESARAVPLSANIVLNKAEILDLVGQARDALPEDLVAADAVVADADAVLSRADNAAEASVAEAAARSRSMIDEARDKADTLLAEANDEAERRTQRAAEEAENTRVRAQAEAEDTLADARAQAERLVSTHHISELAEDRARELVQQARQEANALRAGAQDYVSSSLAQTANLLQDLLRRTEGGLKAIADRGDVDQAANIELD